MRFIESEFSNPGQLDFVPRERRAQIRNVLLAFMVAIVMIFAIGMTPGTVGGNTYAALSSISIVTILCFYVIYSKQQNLDLVMATEYQNMLFAQAAAIGSTFCILVKRDGTVIYANDGMRTLFPNFAYADSQALEGIFEQGGVRRTDRERIMAAIYSGQADRLIFPMKTSTGREQDYVLTIEPLRRPGGFLVIRGREYLDKRTGTQLMPDILRSTTAEKLDHLLTATPAGHYVTDGFGRLEYVNPALERMLGYGGGEILDSKLGIYHLLYQLRGEPVGDDYTLGEYSGEAILQNKHGGLANVKLHQVLIRDTAGKVMGATGSVLPLTPK